MSTSRETHLCCLSESEAHCVLDSVEGAFGQWVQISITELPVAVSKKEGIHWHFVPSELSCDSQFSKGEDNLNSCSYQC